METLKLTIGEDTKKINRDKKYAREYMEDASRYRNEAREDKEEIKQIREAVAHDREEIKKTIQAVESQRSSTQARDVTAATSRGTLIKHLNTESLEKYIKSKK